jgi:hypothetical protein
MVQRFNFLWFVLAGWVVFLLTLQTNGWYFLLGNNNGHGAFAASILAIVLALTGLFISIDKVFNQKRGRETLTVYVTTWILALPLIGLLVLFIGVHLAKV